jgi:hypothetical protein
VVYALGNFFYHLFIKSLQVGWPATGHQAIINHYFFINPFGPGIFEVGLQ